MASLHPRDDAPTSPRGEPVHEPNGDLVLASSQATSAEATAATAELNSEVDHDQVLNDADDDVPDPQRPLFRWRLRHLFVAMFVTAVWVVTVRFWPRLVPPVAVAASIPLVFVGLKLVIGSDAGNHGFKQQMLAWWVGWVLFASPCWSMSIVTSAWFERLSGRKPSSSNATRPSPLPRPPSYSPRTP